ncbi:LysR family transcriptional regulator [Ruegeria sp. HKCCD8929]|uniref:LysR family transcriptional regulator n=1 Tax=Ruegeria sp. HKCCD8929 TaxID=2683006 RepID=UPI001489682B|nr:LysR family transcriptional regulator [Ruegeria sp. HKCCD8929]
MQIDWIETFLDLGETRSFNRTAERLGITQSTVSGRVRSLEAALGKRLFNRSRAGTDLTVEGLHFAPHARMIHHSWTEARNAVRDAGAGGTTIRIGIQNDLVGHHFSELIADFRVALPHATFFLEADYSAQMSSDLTNGLCDFALVFSPRWHPDLHFETLGEVSYIMVSTHTNQLSEVTPERYITPNFSDALPELHRGLYPHLAHTMLSIGQDAAMVALLESMGGTAYVLRTSADRLIRAGICRLVADATPLLQPLYAGCHIKNRHRPVQRSLLGVVRKRFGP